MLEVTIGKSGLDQSWQDNFPETTKCCYCGKESRIGFVVFESYDEEKSSWEQCFVYDLHDNDPVGEGFWVHDTCAVAVYFCKGCLKPTSLYNQR